MDQLLSVAAELYVDWARLALPLRAAVAALLCAFPLAWAWETARYAALLGRPDRVHLAPLQIHGDLLSGMGSQGVALALQGELEGIQRSQRMLTDQPAPYVTPATGRGQGYYLVGHQRGVSRPLRIAGDAPELPQVVQEVAFEVGSVKIPVSGLVNLLSALLGAVFVPFRSQYRRSLIRVSLVGQDQQTRLTVHLTGDRYAADYPRWWQLPTMATLGHLIGLATVPEPRTRERAVLTITRGTSNLTEIADLLRDAAFMVLTLHQGDSLAWWSNRRLIDGLDALADYRRRADKASHARARQAFRDAAAADPEHNHHALYYHGMMTMVERTEESIDEALLHFRAALRPATFPPLQALIHAGLAYCYSQRAHRLGYETHSTLRTAHQHAREAERLWRDALKRGLLDTDAPHPLIPYTYGMVTGVDERPGQDERGRQARDRHLVGCWHFHRAAQLEPDNAMFVNNAGWNLLKLLERGVDRVPARLALTNVTGAGGELPAWVAQDDWEALDDDPPGSPTIPVAEAAEAYLRFALQLQPTNQLTHANLCLLYSMAPFREREDEDRLARCRYHGLKAVALDPEYVNGHRDLAIGLLRYGQRDEALKHYYRALELAEAPDKDRELMRDVLRELKAAFPNLPEAAMRPWTHPPPSYLEPRAGPSPPDAAERGPRS